MSSNSVVLFLALNIFIVANFDGSPTAAYASNDMDVYRLPENTVPLLYNLSISPDYDRSTDYVRFNGEVEITIAVKVRTRKITLNYRGIDLDVAYVYEKSTLDDLDVLGFELDAKNEQFNISLVTELEVGVEYIVDIEFHRKSKKDMTGFYKSEYQNPDGGKE